MPSCVPCLLLLRGAGQTIVAIASGANMDFDRLRFVSERSDSTESLLAVRIGEKPGSFRQLYSAIFPRNVTEFSYRYNNPETADVIISYQSMVGSSRDEDKVQVVKAISNLGASTHMAGGERERAPAA
jgi:threonine dehydratase